MTREHDYPGQPRNGGAERTATSPIAASQSGQSLGPTKRKGVALEPTRRHRSAPRGPILLDLQQRARPLAGSGVETPVLSPTLYQSAASAKDDFMEDARARTTRLLLATRFVRSVGQGTAFQAAYLVFCYQSFGQFDA